MTLKVNGQEIPDEAIEFEFSRLVRFYSQHMSNDEIKGQVEVLKERARDQAIGAKLLIDQATKMDFKVEASAVDAKFDATVAEVGGMDKFEEVIGKQGLTVEMVKENISEGCRVDMLVEKVTEGIDDPTEAEIEKHFKEHSSEYSKPERAEARHILVKADPNDDKQREQAMVKILEVKKRVEDGGDFIKEAEDHSDCPSGKSNGGSLGWFSRGMMVPEFDEAVFTMPVDSLSDVVETQFGYHVISKTGHEDGGDVAFDDVKENIREFLRHTTRGEVLSSYVRELREKATIED